MEIAIGVGLIAAALLIFQNRRAASYLGIAAGTSDTKPPTITANPTPPTNQSAQPQPNIAQQAAGYIKPAAGIIAAGTSAAEGLGLVGGGAEVAADAGAAAGVEAGATAGAEAGAEAGGAVAGGASVAGLAAPAAILAGILIIDYGLLFGGPDYGTWSIAPRPGYVGLTYFDPSGWYEGGSVWVPERYFKETPVVWTVGPNGEIIPLDPQAFSTNLPSDKVIYYRFPSSGVIVGKSPAGADLESPVLFDFIVQRGNPIQVIGDQFSAGGYA